MGLPQLLPCLLQRSLLVMLVRAVGAVAVRIHGRAISSAVVDAPVLVDVFFQIERKYHNQIDLFRILVSEDISKLM
jgi:hypothetical protein